MYTYLLLNIFTLSIPLLRSFERRVAFYKDWKFLFPAIAITGAFFIVWDVVFTQWGVWGFTPRYLLGVDLLNLPLEEWLFFITIPYACVFTYVALGYFIKKDYLASSAKAITLILAGVLLVLALLHTDKLYTVTTFSLMAALLLLHALVLKSTYMGRFYLAYAVILIPFFVVNGILTGSFIEEQVVWYNDAENLGLRMGTIPVEDAMYGMLLILMNITLFEGLKQRANR